MDARGDGGVLLRLQWRMEECPAVQAELAREEASVPHRHSSSIDSAVKENAHRFERPIHDGSIAAAYYRDADGGLVFIHTEVPTAFSGQGIATDLARGTFELIRQSKRKAILKCLHGAFLRQASRIRGHRCRVNVGRKRQCEPS